MLPRMLLIGQEPLRAEMSITQFVIEGIGYKSLMLDARLLHDSCVFLLRSSATLPTAILLDTRIMNRYPS